ncbi:site-2 protease family protein [Bacillus sp. ISL-75]|uniref:site-2 protease family protein n=1 Tax=Bacillus sp. ISL-75 TaxID=2819137 RepID=UPI001BE7A69D|nr:site-2 protease family protein [Bacillus sp. ISL-75]MBT2730356.1 site-2 protease family protein [Bacillus sp. ISL-75]
MYYLFVLGVGLFGLVLVGIAGYYMVLEVLGKGKENGSEKSFNLSIYAFVVLSFAGYLIKSPPLTWNIVLLVGKAYLILYLIIILHELGHLLAAKTMNLPITVFSIGIGPNLYSFEFKGISFEFKLIPGRGFVKTDAEKEENLPLYQKCIFYLGGIFVNILSFFVGLSIFFVQQGQSVLESFKIVYQKFIALISLYYSFITQLKFTDIYTPERDLENSIGLYISAADIAQEFWLGFAAISIVLALFNLIPIPVLDGGRVVLAIFNSLLGAIGIPQKWVKTFFYTMLVLGAMFLYSPIIINNLWSSSQSLGMSLVEFVLWTAIIIVGLINIQIFLENRRNKMKPIE